MPKTFETLLYATYIVHAVFLVFQIFVLVLVDEVQILNVGNHSAASVDLADFGLDSAFVS